MARARAKFTIRRTKTTSEYESQLELRDEDKRRFFRNPSRYLQGQLRQQRLRWRKVGVSKVERATVQRALASATVVVIIKGRWMHIDFDTQHPERACEWFFEITDIIIVVEQM